MKILGKPIFAKNENGKLESRIGTIFFRTPGLVTQRGIHAMQRAAWIEELNRIRALAGKEPMSENEAAEELADSVDLLFTEDTVLIRPDPTRMDLAAKADEVLQTLVPKSKIRFLNTHISQVRDTLRKRGENWRMTRKPMSPAEMDRHVASSRCAINVNQVYFYNGATGTRFLTAGTFTSVAKLPPAEMRAQMEEIFKGLRTYNRLGQQEIELFPRSATAGVAQKISSIDPSKLDDAQLSAAVGEAALDYRMSIDPKLREEDVNNIPWRNAICAEITRAPNETDASEADLIDGISPEFYRQVHWLPGARIENGAVIFDSIYEEAERTQDPDVLALCDSRVRSIIFNLIRLFGEIEYVNVGRIVYSLASYQVPGVKRGTVYLIQFREKEFGEQLFVIRFQKWGVAEHLDEGKDLLRAIYESDQYTDYILDRRLACRQLGMKLPQHMGFGQCVETYRGNNHYNGTTVNAHYFMRNYIGGIASDKVPQSRFQNPSYAKRFAELMGEAASMDMIVGRLASETHANVFDTNYEVLRPGLDGLPMSIAVIDHAGSFVGYKESYDELVGAYANTVLKRKDWVSDFRAFAETFVASFKQGLEKVQNRYRMHPQVFDNLFLQRPYDIAGSTAYRWHCILARLEACNPDRVAKLLEKAIGL